MYYNVVSDNGKDLLLFSSIYYYQSAIDTLIRAKNNNSEIGGTISPGYLVDKDFFVFQEDQVFDLSLVDIEILQSRVASAKDQQLVNFVIQNKNAKVTALQINEFYGNASEFNDSLDEMVTMQTNGCSSSCWIGCGSDTGCCGNYSGCCVYSSAACYIHDVQCATCVPPRGFISGYCGPSCQPGLNKPVKYLVSLSIFA